ncbi:MAG: hypothetical protein AVDCRST_MAG77-4452 [uncultured Chloroflexi bacterium]|uniref:Uncharacterized protein n=1 Tax=uncultured Chloroflexota bacterium TaxID=166587 RepID=A0A6J4JUF4_9CHLR|nr:MAG: hypothetical protein AVDCRST_MAG77-4452 [uncultured Chloroflexota bacterium]
MYPTQHAAITAITALPLRRRGWNWTELSLFAAGAVLIDVDHYLSYAVREGDWSLPRAYRWHIRRVPPMDRRRPHLYLPPLLWDQYRWFHAIVPLALLALAARLWPPLRPLALGALYHRLQDYAVEVFEHRPGVPTAAPED